MVDEVVVQEGTRYRLDHESHLMVPDPEGPWVIVGKPLWFRDQQEEIRLLNQECTRLQLKVVELNRQLTYLLSYQRGESE